MNKRARKDLTKVDLVCLKCGHTYTTQNTEDPSELGKYIIKRCYKNKLEESDLRTDFCPNCKNTNKKDVRIFVDESIKIQKLFELLELYGNSDIYRKFVDDKRPFYESSMNRVLVRFPFQAMTVLGFEMDNAIVTTCLRAEKTQESIDYIKRNTKHKLTVAGIGSSYSVDSISLGYEDSTKYNLDVFYLANMSCADNNYRNVDIGEVVLNRNKAVNLQKSPSTKMICKKCVDGTGIETIKTPYCPGCGLNNTLVKKNNCLICLGTSVPKYPFAADNFNIKTEPCNTCISRGYMNSKKDFFLGPLGIPIPKGIAELIATSKFTYIVRLLSGTRKLHIKTDMFDIIVFLSRVAFSASDIDEFLGPIGVQMIEFDSAQFRRWT